MIHMANQNNRDAICSGRKVPNKDMSEADLKWAGESSVIKQDANGYWYHSLITDRDRSERANRWRPDTGRERENQF